MGSTVTKEAWATLSDLFGPSFDLAVTDVDGDPLLWADDAPVIAAASRDASDASFAVAPTESWSHVLTTSRGRAVNGGGATGPASQTSVTFPEFPQFSFPEVASKQAAAPTPAVAAPSTTAVLSATPSLQQQQQQQPQTTSTATTAMIKKTPSFKSPSRVDKEDAAPAACYLCSTSSNVKVRRDCWQSSMSRTGLCLTPHCDAVDCCAEVSRVLRERVRPARMWQPQDCDAGQRPHDDRRHLQDVQRGGQQVSARVPRARSPPHPCAL
jgi:hypothetical protein